MVFDCEQEAILKVGTSAPYTQPSEGFLERGRNTCMASNGARLVRNIFWTNFRPIESAPYIYTSTVELRTRMPTCSIRNRATGCRSCRRTENSS